MSTNKLKEFKLTKLVTVSYESYVMAENWEDAEEKGHYNDSLTWIINNERSSIDAEEIE